MIVKANCPAQHIGPLTPPTYTPLKFPFEKLFPPD